MDLRSASRLAAVLMTLMIGLIGASPASADFASFLESSSDPGLLTTTANFLGATFSSTTASDGTITFIAINNGWTVTDFHNTYNIVESTGEISDLLEVTGSSTARSITVSFTSDTEGSFLFGFLHPTATITETGAPQDVDTILAYAFDPAGVPHDLTLTIQSDAEAVPEPATAFLLLTGCVSLLGYGWRRKKLQGSLD